MKIWSLLSSLRGLPRTSFRIRQVSEAEILEELQFHLEMRLADNVAAGMPLEDALRDARHRFGDFGQNYRACRRVTSGLGLSTERLQAGLLIMLLAMVVGLGVALMRTQLDFRSTVQALTAQLNGLREAAWRESRNQIPYVTWPSRLAKPSSTVPRRSLPAVADWDSVKDPMARPWCDWQSLTVSE